MCVSVYVCVCVCVCVVEVLCCSDRCFKIGDDKERERERETSKQLDFRIVFFELLLLLLFS